MIQPPRWATEQLKKDLARAQEIFRQERLQEPLEAYLDAFERYQGSFENLLETSVDLIELERTAIDVLTDRQLLEAFRYLAGPPLSQDDLKTLSEAVLTPGRLREDPRMVGRIIDVVRIALDRRRFPWVTEGREPTEEERAAAVLASAALMATSRVTAMRRNEGKDAQEQLLEDTLIKAGLRRVQPRAVQTVQKAPEVGTFCRESLFGGRKADFLIGLWDARILAVECKVSNSSTNSVKRLNNDAAIKAEVWIQEFGWRQVVPAAVLSGVYKIHNLEDAQTRGLTLFWAHDLAQLTQWIGRTGEAM
ncbi:MAG: XamI family restriction endonuclease [Bryobacteraceae bacterium]|nr:XamI family restriction endonuclease [Bryobacteraceae bacterium]